jgi:hypothetical protein
MSPVQASEGVLRLQLSEQLQVAIASAYVPARTQGVVAAPTRTSIVPRDPRRTVEYIEEFA